MNGNNKNKKNEDLINEYNKILEEERKLEKEKYKNKSHKREMDYPESNEEENNIDSNEDEEYSENKENNEDENNNEDDKDKENEKDNENQENNDDEKEKQNEDENDSKEEKEDNKENEKSEDKKDSDEKDKSSDNLNKRKDNKDKLNPQRNTKENKNTDVKKGKNFKDKIADKAIDKLKNNRVVHTAKRAKELTSAVAQSAKNLATTSLTLLKTLLNPIFWIVISIIIIFIMIIAAFQIMGKNDFNKLCDGKGLSDINIEDDLDDHERQSAIAAWLMTTSFKVNGDKPMNKEQAGAIVGNFMLESYMANPKTIQGDSSMTSWQTCDNDCIIGWGGSGKAVGLVQWMGDRRLGLAKFAKEENTQWYDLATQLKFLKMELDGEGPGGSYDMQQLIKGGFHIPGKTLEDYTWIWQAKFERAGETKNDKAFKLREKYAKEFYQRFDGTGAAISSGMIANCSGGSSIDASSLVELAKSIAYTREEKRSGLGYGSCGGYINCGQSFSKPEYIEAKRMVEEETGKDPLTGLLASCDRLVATMVKMTKIDVDFPYGNTAIQINYMNDSSNGWQKVSCQDRQPGDVFGRMAGGGNPHGHIMIYVGDVDGKDTMVSASIQSRSAQMSDISCVGDLFRGDDMNVQGWRKVN